MTPYTLAPLDTSQLTRAFDLATAVFARSSSLHTALSVDPATYKTALRPSFEAMVMQNLSWAALDPEGRMLGCLIATDITTALSENPAPNPYPQIGALTAALTNPYLARRKCKPGEAVLVDMAAIHPDARRLGLYRALRQQLQDRTRDAGWRYVVGELSSSATQHVVLNKMGHKPMAEIRFADFEWNGTRPFQSITSPPSIILAEGTL